MIRTDISVILVNNKEYFGVDEITLLLTQIQLFFNETGNKEGNQVLSKILQQIEEQMKAQRTKRKTQQKGNWFKKLLSFLETN